MRRTTVMLPAALKLEAQRVARNRGISLGDLIRRALAAELRPPREVGQSDPLFSDDAVWTGDAPDDLAQEHDRYLHGADSAGGKESVMPRAGSDLRGGGKGW